MGLKKIIIIGAFADNEEKEKMLSECIDNLSFSGYDLMVVSHKPIPSYIQEKINFSIYDKENILDPYEFTPNYFYRNTDFLVEIKSRGHMIPVCRNMINGISLVNHLGYDFFFFLEFDNLIDKNDIHLFNLLHYEMLINNKKMIFFNQLVENKEIYESLIFAGTPSFFLKNTTLPLCSDDFRKIKMESTLEKSFYSQFRSFENELLLIKNSSKLFFKNSSINKIANYAIIDIVKDLTHNKFSLWISNSIDNENPLIIRINDNEPFTLGTGGWITRPIEIGQKIKVEVNENGFFNVKQFELNEKNKNDYSNKSTITYY